MGLTRQELQDRLFASAIKTKRKWELIRAIKSETGKSTADTLDDLVKLLTNE